MYELMRPLLVIGCGGHSKVVTEIAESTGFSNISYLGSNQDPKQFLGRRVQRDWLEDYRGYFFVAIGDNALRQQLFSEFMNRNPVAIPVTLIHPSSIISSSCSIGSGTVIMPLCVVNGPSSIGDGVILNTRSSVDHDSGVMSFCSLAPGVTLGGGVTIGERSAIGIGATVKHGVCIGNDSIVGAGSLVLNDIGSLVVAYGSPAIFVKSRVAGERYL
jgi:sugar O-acyltransferase (sialic acid O-acetyltransferase NeuD family)